MANHYSHAALPFPVRGARYTVQIPYLDADGDPTDPTTPDTEISKDAGAFADCAEEVSTITGSNGLGYITLTGAEMDASMLGLAAKVASGPKATLGTFYPRILPVAFSGTASAGASGSITLAGCPAVSDLLIGCIVKTTGGTGGGGTGGANNQARVITAYTSGRVATISPAWETTPDNTTTFEVLLTEFAALRFSDVKLWQGDAQSATDAKDLFDAGYDSSVHTISASIVSAGITSSSFAAGAINAAAIASDAITDAKVASDVTIASVTGAVGSVTEDFVHTGTAQAGGASSITLAAGASATDNIYNYQRIDITDGTGIGQSAIITDYVGSTKVATVDYAWNVTPDNTSVYRVAFSRVPRSVSKVTGDVEGKILGTASGGGTMSGAGVWAYDHTGAAISSGGSSDWTADEKAAIKTILGVPASGTTPDVPSAGALKVIDDFLDTEIAAIKTKTDLIPSAPAEVGSAMTLADGAITAAKFASGAIDAAAIATDAFGALELAAGAASEIAAAVVDQTLSGHTTAGTVGGALNAAGSGSLGSAGADPLTTPAATATYGEKLDFIHAVLTNEQTQTKTLQTVARADGTVISEAPVTSDGTTVTREKFANP